MGRRSQGLTLSQLCGGWHSWGCGQEECVDVYLFPSVRAGMELAETKGKCLVVAQFLWGVWICLGYTGSPGDSWEGLIDASTTIFVLGCGKLTLPQRTLFLAHSFLHRKLRVEVSEKLQRKFYSLNGRETEQPPAQMGLYCCLVSKSYLTLLQHHEQ